MEIFLENLVGLNPRNPTSYPNQPTGPRSTVGVQTYHELEFTTPSAYSLAPVSIHPSVGEVYFYPGDNKQYVWNLPKGVTTATLTLTAAEDYPIHITDMIVKSYKATFHC